MTTEPWAVSPRRKSSPMRKSGLWLVLLTVLALLAAACGSDDETTSAETTSTEAATTDTEAAPDEEPEPADEGTSLEGSTVEIMSIRGTDDPEGAALVAALEIFSERTGVEINYQGVGDELPTILSTRVEGGSPPNIAFLAQPGLVTDLVSRDALVEIEGAVGATLDADFAPVWRDLGSVDGTLYGVYFKAANKSTVFYRLDVFEQLALEIPTTLEEWIETNQTLVDNGFTPLAVGGADGWTLSDWFENFYVRSAGPEAYASLTAHEIPWTDPSVVKTFEEMNRLIGVDEFLDGGREGALQTGFVDSIVAALGTEPTAVMVYEGDFIAGIAPEEAGTQAGVDWDFFDFPSIGGSPGAVVGGGDVAVAFSDDDATMAVMAFLASPEFAGAMIPTGGFASPSGAADLSLYPDEISRRSAEALVSAETFVFDMSDLSPAALGATAGSGIWGELQNWLQNPDDLDAVLEALESDAAAAFGG